MDTGQNSSDYNPPQHRPTYSVSNAHQMTFFECKPKRSSRRHRRTGKRHRARLRTRLSPQRSRSSSSQTDSPTHRPSGAHGHSLQEEVSHIPMSVRFGNPWQSNRFWETYGRACEWQHRHHIAYWKSRATILENENNKLRTCFEGQSNLCQPNVQQCEPDRPRFEPIQQNTFPEYDVPTNNLQGRMGEQAYNIPCSPTSAATYQPSRNQYEPTRPGSSRYKPSKIGTPSYFWEESNMIREKVDNSYLSTVAENDEDDESLEFEINEEMMAFLEQSMKHKLELSEQRKRERLESEKEQRQIEYESSLPPQLVCKWRIAEMKRLYGEGAPKIIAMETSVKLTFERRLRNQKPQLWPVIALRP